MNITKGMLQNIIDNSNIQTSILDDRALIVALCLPNGYILVEYHQEYTKEQFDEEKAYTICLGRLKNKILQLENYLSYDRITYGYDIENEYE
ncbi:MAG: Gp49 family protein [Clostridium sp.]